MGDNKYMNKEKGTRNIIIDIMKGLGIILVVFGHVINSNVVLCKVNINNALYIFHMPLFFIISGYLIKYEQSSQNIDYVKKKFKGILIPYFLFSIICFLYWMIIERRIRNQLSTPIFNVLGNIFLCRVDETLLLPNVVLWFLPCLFTAEIIYYLLRKLGKKYIVLPLVFIIFILGIILCNNNIVLPFAMETAFVAILFICVGHLVEEYEIYLKPKLYFLFPIFIVCYIMALVYNGNVSMLAHNYGRIPLFVVGAISGSEILYVISLLITKIKVCKNILIFYGVNSITVMLCHEPIKRIVVKIVSIITKINIEIIRNNFMGSLLITIVVLVILIPIIYVINTYVPFFVGKKQKYTKF